MINRLKECLKDKNYLVFDFDRTLAKMEIDWSYWYAGMSDIYNQFDSKLNYNDRINPHEFYNHMANLYGASLIEKIKKFNQEYEAKYLTGFTPNQELVDFVMGNSTHNLFVYSSNSYNTVNKGLNYLGIRSKFKKIITQDDVNFIKPNPEGFYLIDEFKENKQSFLMIGDSSADRKAAYAAGIDFLECNTFEKYFGEE